MNEIIVGRPINGITLNDLEYLLDENGDIMKFKSKEHAISYLKKQGVSEIRAFSVQLIDWEKDLRDLADKLHEKME